MQKSPNRLLKDLSRNNYLDIMRKSMNENATVNEKKSGELYTKLLQRSLNESGYRDEDGNLLKVDGKFGKKTAYAYNEYSGDESMKRLIEGLKKRGIVGKEGEGIVGNVDAAPSVERWQEKIEPLPRHTGEKAKLQKLPYIIGDVGGNTKHNEPYITDGTINKESISFFGGGDEKKRKALEVISEFSKPEIQKIIEQSRSPKYNGENGLSQSAQSAGKLYTEILQRKLNEAGIGDAQGKNYARAQRGA